MNFLIYGLIVGLVGGLNPSLAKIKTAPVAYLFGWLARAAIFGVPATIISYFEAPALVGPFWGLYWALLVCWLVNTVVTWFLTYLQLARSDRDAGRYREVSDEERIKNACPALTLVLFLLLGGTVIIRSIMGSEMVNAGEYAKLIGTVETRDWDKDLKPVDTKHIRMVSQEQAVWVGDKALGEAPDALGSRFKTGTYTLQRVRDELMWVAPLEYANFGSWWKNEYCEGFVMVSAEDHTKEPKLVLGKKMRYMPSGRLWDNLHRYLYQSGYTDVNLVDFTFEVDDENLQPYWVITLTRPSIQFWGPRIVGVLVVNPETGKIDEYTQGTVPEWADRVLPEDLIEQYVKLWGQYHKKGYWNTSKTFGAQTDVMVPAQEDMRLVYGSDGHAKWYTGMSSSNKGQQGLTGFMYVDSRSGKATFYPHAGTNEEGAKSAINAAVANYAGWHATDIIPYPINGELAYVSPIAGKGHMFQKLAIIRVTKANQGVALGTTRDSALREFRKLIASVPSGTIPGQEAKAKVATFTIDRMAIDLQEGNTLYLLYTKEFPNKIFAGTSLLTTLPLAKVGDEVTVTYMETTEEIVSIRAFSLKGLEMQTKKKPAEQK